MAFSLFKKKNYADCVIRGGKIYTLDPECPEAEALAVKGGRVLYAGSSDEIKQYEGPDTEIIDLGGAYAVPGFIDCFGSPAEQTFEGSFLRVSSSSEIDEIMRSIADYFEKDPGAEYCLAVDVDEKLIVRKDSGSADVSEEPFGLRARLSVQFPDKPVILVASNGLSMQLNDAAAQIVSARAEEIGISSVTPAFVIDSIVSTDYDRAVPRMMIIAEGYAKLGVTGVYAVERYSFFESMYRDLLMEAFQGEGMMKQRYYGSYAVRRRLPPTSVLYMADRKRTVCQELRGLINFHSIEIRFSSEKESPDFMSRQYVEELAGLAADKGYSVRFIALDRDAVLTAFDIAGSLSSSNRRQSFSVVHKEDITDGDLGAVYTGDAIELALGGPRRKDGLKGEDLVRYRSQQSASAIGAYDAGTLEEGKLADLAVFDKDPFSSEELTEASALIVAGRLVWKNGGKGAKEWSAELFDVIGKSAAELFGDGEQSPEIL